MPIRARVGRHTRSGGGHCQNWADDQKVIIDLLNSIPRTSGGTQGSLNPRIVAGICSNELYAAISAFEDKYWPGQRSGYIDPGGAMYQKLAPAAPTPSSAADHRHDSPSSDGWRDSVASFGFRRHAQLR
jgi:hypothetical protein